jgi:hypothetical protein
MDKGEHSVRRFEDVFVYDLFGCFLCATFFSARLRWGWCHPVLYISINDICVFRVCYSSHIGHCLLCNCISFNQMHGCVSKSRRLMYVRFHRFYPNIEANSIKKLINHIDPNSSSNLSCLTLLIHCKTSYLANIYV